MVADLRSMSGLPRDWSLTDVCPFIILIFFGLVKVAEAGGMSGLLLGWSLTDISPLIILIFYVWRMVAEVGGMSGLLLGWSFVYVCPSSTSLSIWWWLKNAECLGCYWSGPSWTYVASSSSFSM